MLVIVFPIIYNSAGVEKSTQMIRRPPKNQDILFFTPANDIIFLVLCTIKRAVK